MNAEAFFASQRHVADAWRATCERIDTVTAGDGHLHTSAVLDMGGNYLFAALADDDDAPGFIITTADPWEIGGSWLHDTPARINGWWVTPINADGENIGTDSHAAADADIVDVMTAAVRSLRDAGLGM